MVFIIKLIIFITISIGIFWISRFSLRNIQSHGFYRFFAWEGILLLILFNIDFWFENIFSINQIISWVFLIISTVLVICGVHVLYTRGKLDSNRKDENLFDIEKTTELVTTGIYRYIRHPLYSSLLFLTWGVFFKHLSWLNISLAVVTTFFLFMTAKKEEIENISYFGNDYISFMKRTKMFIPLFF